MLCEYILLIESWKSLIYSKKIQELEVRLEFYNLEKLF